MKIWGVMDDCIRVGVTTTETTLPGRLQLRRRAPMLYRRLMRGFYPGIASTQMHMQQIGGQVPMSAVEGTIPEEDKKLTEAGRLASTNKSDRKVTARATRVVGSFNHPLLPMPPVISFLKFG